jgi:hypothetical protein
VEGFSVATNRISQATHFKGDQPHKRDNLVLQFGVFGMEMTIPPNKYMLCREASAEETLVHQGMKCQNKKKKKRRR